MNKWKVLILSLILENLHFVFFQWPKGIYQVTSDSKKMPIKSILIWNSPHRLEMARTFGAGTQAFVKKKCLVTQCQIVRNRSAMPFAMFDAVVMNMLELTSLPEQEGFKRQQHQRYVFLSQESPPTINLNTLNFEDYFNWTMSYRTNSDVLIQYGSVVAKTTAPVNQSDVNRLINLTHKSKKNYLVKKIKSVVWMTSHCSTVGFREEYVYELRKYIDVDIYGGCGKLACPHNEEHWISDPLCYNLMARRYKFYLSFENSVCHDYATEKFFEILSRNIIPVVYGGANYSQLAPPHSYINALQYTPRQLARLMHRLASNHALYNEYFWWKPHYKVESGPLQMIRNGFCDLCRKLHQDPSVKIHQDITEQWSWPLQCWTMSSWIINSTFTTFF